jgi:hypothetical protein
MPKTPSDLRLRNNLMLVCLDAENHAENILRRLRRVSLLITYWDVGIISRKKKECLPHTPPRAETKISTMFWLILITNIVAQIPLDDVGELTLDFSIAPFLSSHLMK